MTLEEYKNILEVAERNEPFQRVRYAYKFMRELTDMIEPPKRTRTPKKKNDARQLAEELVNLQMVASKA